MNSNIRFPITKPIHPKFIIQYAVDSLVRGLYSVDYQARVVRQRRKLDISTSLSHVDYAVPCFEIANIVGESAEAVAQALCHGLKGRLVQEPETEYFKKIKTESVGGYVNFELDNAFVTDIVTNTMQWFESPTTQFNGHGYRIALLGYDDSSEGDVADVLLLHAVLGDLLQTLDISYETQVQVPNATGIFISDLARQSNELSIKQFKERYLQDEDGIGQFTKKFAAQCAALERIYTPARKESQYRLYKQTELWPNVQEYINDLKNQSMSEVCIFDEANKAVYVSLHDTIAPLRSVNGFTYQDSYRVYGIEMLTKSASTEDRVHFVCICPQYEQVFLKEWVRVAELDTNVMFFDPQVSRADINELCTDSYRTSELFSRVVSFLQTILETNDMSTAERDDLLYIIDAPMDIQMSLSQSYMPQVFDLLNQLRATVSR